VAGSRRKKWNVQEAKLKTLPKKAPGEKRGGGGGRGS